MRAIGCTKLGDPAAVLGFHERPVPEPGPRDLLVRVAAAAINPVDVKVVTGTRGGALEPGRVLIPGFDACGVVERAGSACARFGPGDPVFFAGDIGRDGCHAEYACVDERLVGRKPERLTDADAAAMPLTALTAWEALVETLGAPDDGSATDAPCLVLGGAGGVGSIAIQIARRVCGLRVVATASRPESRAFCERMGAHAVIDHTRPLDTQTRALGIEGYACVLTTAGLDAFQEIVSVLAPLGRIASILPPKGPLDLAPLFPLRGSLGFELMFTRPRTGREPERHGAILDRVAELLDEGVLVSTRTATLDWTDYAQAFARIRTGHTLGKLVMTVGGSGAA